MPVEFGQFGEQDRSDGDVDADPEGVGARDDLEAPLLGQLFDQQPVSGQQPGVVNADAETEEAFELAAVRCFEAGVADRLADRLAFGPAGQTHRGQALGQFGAVVAGEVDDVDRGAAGVDEVLNGFVERRFAVLEFQGYGPIGRGDVGRRDPRETLDPPGDRRDVAESRRHQQKPGVGQSDQRDLPRPAPVPVGIVVELVHDDGRRFEAFALPKGHVGQDLGGAADHRRVGIDRGVAGLHADVFRSQNLAQGKEFLAGQGLDR